jgi:hypothetical protein
MSERRVDVFFYGLFMDIGVLRQSGVEPVNPRRASADGFALRIGRRATLVAAPRPEERNPDYAVRLQAVLRDLEFPPEYVASVGGEAECS